MNQAKLVVGQINMLEALTNKGIAVNLVDVAVTQIQGNDIIVSIALGLQYLYERIMSEV